MLITIYALIIYVGGHFAPGGLFADKQTCHDVATELAALALTDDDLSTDTADFISCEERTYSVDKEKES